MKSTKVEGKNNKNKIFLYTLSTCGWCRKTKKYLQENDFEYEYIDVDKLPREEQRRISEDFKARKMTFGFPTIIINDEQIISGFKKEKLDKALGIKTNEKPGRGLFDRFRK